MNNEKIIPLLRGTVTHLPGIKKVIPNRTGGTIESRYCYSVWMRHLIYLSHFKNEIPENCAELGPGDSFGIGLAALLSGCQCIHALDVVKYGSNKNNLRIFNELVELFRNKADIPDETEYPNVKPKIENYHFPSGIISDKILHESLLENRLNAIRKEISDLYNPQNSFIKVYIPWNNAGIIQNESIDFIYSQAVLEHVENLEDTYLAMKKWLKPLGFMSHTIDFKSHGITKSWNGHWLFSDFEWNIVKGGKPFLINRQPQSKHIELHLKFGFEIAVALPVKLKNNLKIKDISDKFKNLSETDLTTSGIYILSKKMI